MAALQAGVAAARRTPLRQWCGGRGPAATSFIGASMNAAHAEDAARLIPRVDPDGLAAAFILSLLATAGFFYVNIMGAIVSGLIDGLHLSAAEAGRIGACNVYGAAVGAFGAVLVVRRVAWRRASVLLLCGLVGFDLASMWAHSAGLLTALRLMHGVTGGLLVGISYAVLCLKKKKL